MSVEFAYARWAARFPELAGYVAEPLASAYFAEATLYCANGPGSVVKNEIRRGIILNLIVAHIAKLNAPINGQAATPLVGRINSATEGSVTVQADLQIKSENAQWWAQTQYGLQAWQALAQYRTARYVPGRPRVQDPWGRLFRG
jgi:Protein of unknown function (DUF4054)